MNRRTRQDDRTRFGQPQADQPRSLPRKEGFDGRVHGSLSRARDRDVGQQLSGRGQGLAERGAAGGGRAADGPPGPGRPSQRVTSPGQREDVAPPRPPSAPHQRRPVPRRWDLAAQNAPRRVVNLIGDPRTGIADDTTGNPFGEVTVDMVHHQQSNEVYWFKYDFAGAQLHGSHRDARLSDYTRNLMYLLRAKDPKRWTVEALALKFRVRKQRVLAILALKELEAQRIEDGRLLAGPLSAYALTVHTDDVHLDPVTGDPRLSAPRAAAARQEGSAGSAPVPEAAAGQFRLDGVSGQVLAQAQQLQLQLIDALTAHGQDPERLRTALLADVQLAADLAARVLGGSPGGSGENTAAATLPYLLKEMQAYREALETVVAAVDGVLRSSPLLLEERLTTALRCEIESALAGAADEVCKEALGLPMSYATVARAATAEAALRGGGGDVAAGAGADGSGSADADSAGAGSADAGSAGLRELRQVLSLAFEPVMKAGDDGALKRVWFALSPRNRGLLLRLLPDVSIRLNAAGVDLVRDTKLAGPGAAAPNAKAPAGGLQQLPVDIFGFMPVPEHRLEALTAAVQSLAEAQTALTGKIVALDPDLGTARKSSQSAAVPPIPDMKLIRQFVRRYVAADAMWADLLVPPNAAESKPYNVSEVDPAKMRRMLEVLGEADPTAVTRALQVEASQQLLAQRAYAEADTLIAGVGAAAVAEARGAAPPTRPGDRASWEALAAYLDVKVAGKVYGSGSGERHVARLPSFPAFEGYSLEEFDQANESELSILNRKVAERTDAEMYDRFQDDLLYNLGVRGEKLRDSAHGQAAWQPNLRTELERPVVVYGISPDGATQCPPLYVATADGKKRPLNEQEQVFQERRAVRPRLPYYMGRFRRMPELE